MKVNEDGFRALYHFVSAFELNDYLQELIKDCPDAAKASHAVFYGYIDPKKGLMLELLGAGKQAPKYFYFKDPYEGNKVAIPASKVADVEYMFFPDLEKRFYKKFEPKIAKLKKYDASEDLEKSRTFDFLDESRSPQYPDDVKVRFLKEGLNAEECWIRITGLGDHVFLGTLLNQPYQDFGCSKGDTVEFFVRETEDKHVVCLADFNTHELSKEDLENGSLLKQAIACFNADRTDDNFGTVLTVLRSSTVILPCDALLNPEAHAIAEKYEKAGKDLSEMSEEEEKAFHDGIQMIPKVLEGDNSKAMAAFSSETEMGEESAEVSKYKVPFIHAMDMAMDLINEIDGIVINPFSEAFFVDKELFGTIRKLDPIFTEEGAESLDCQGSHTSYNNSDLDVEIAVGKMDVFNFALYQNSIAPIRGIIVQNRTGDPIKGLSLRITSDFQFFKNYEMPLPPIPSGKPITLDDPHLIVNGQTLANLTEAVNTVITVELCKGDDTICGCRGNMQVLAYDQWQGSNTYQDLLPAFVLPNHPVIPALMHDAADRLKIWNKPTSLEGYQAKDPNRVRDLAAAAYAAIQKKNIVYAEPPASFSVIGQRIRTPETIMEQRLGTCMDMTLLYAACLEAMGLHPLLVMMKGHIFAGVWLKERTPEEMKSGNIIIDSLEQLTMRINNGSDEMTFVECTSMCSGKQISFEESEKIAKLGNLADEEEFRFAIDVFGSRVCGVKPIAFRVKDSGEYQITIEEKPEDEVTSAPKALDITISDAITPKTHKIMSKRELWESKLLDLSLHNMLLNLPHNSSVEPIMSSHIDELEDALADGHEFHLLPVADWLLNLSYTKTSKDGKESKPIQWLPEAIKEQGVFELTNWPVSTDFDFNEKFRQEYRNHRLYTFNTPAQLDRELTTLYRAARSSQQENGVSSLYLALGLLRWFAPESKAPCYAPLILIPIEIVRKSANQGYALHARDEEPHFNTTLLEMLKQNYNLEIQGLDPLPTDEHGINIKKVFSIVRGALYTVKGWDVVESCAIGNFSFAQFAMWNDIHTAGDTLENSKVVRSLMKGHVDWDVSADENKEEQTVYLPITVDGTQLQAIKMAANGSTFVLHGPPGTGKSQTITGMIANLMAQGKTVLFVAEKMAALSVVQRRLTSLGIGDFCLEVHSDKANKKQVLSQMERALSTVRIHGLQDNYDEHCKKTAASRSKLDSYAKRLHSVRKCGYSLHDLIDLYEANGSYDTYIAFSRDDAGKLTDVELRSHQPLIGQLLAAGKPVKALLTSPLCEIGLSSYEADVRNFSRRYADSYVTALRDIKEASDNAAALINTDIPVTREDLVGLHNTLSYYKANNTVESEVLKLLELGTVAADAYFAQEDALRGEERALLERWRPDFLTRDMSDYLSRHEAAGKKFFGKGTAIQSITAEVQTFSLRPLVYEQIPELLGAVSKFQERKAQLAGTYEALPETVRQFVQIYKNKEALAKAYQGAVCFKQQADTFPGGLDAILALAGSNEAAVIFDNFEKAYQCLIDAETGINEYLERDPKQDCDNWIEHELAFCDCLKKHASDLKDWTLYTQIRGECIKVGLKPVVDSFECGMDPGIIPLAYKSGIYYALIDYVISCDDVLSRFSGATFNESIQQFKRLDDDLLNETKNELHHLLSLRIPSSWDSPEIGMELNLLRKAIGSNARGMSIRSLFERIPNVLPRICPCMLMSPNSVAQYLAHKNDLFDVVIFDEASQLPTCKAIGALSRAKNAVIVGDPKQMPPTSFFAGSGPEVDDLALDDLDSILDDALALGIPSQHLQWHYRSTHESLIAFSNNQFYGNKMYTFPSANDMERHVTAVHVEGIYNKSTNPKEAEAVVAEIVRRFGDPVLRKQSIGVVTFNVKQQTLIENLLAKQYQVNPELDEWANAGDDPLFVKNLENVQGDERDVILFSIGYGPDEKGHISMNFGPINKSGGGKRLNVAFSRARITMTIFSSIYSSDIKVTETSPEGLIAFREFLKFAEGQDIHTESKAEAEAKMAMAGVMQTICSKIRDAGYQCESMVGHSDFHVDIAVIDPYNPTQYLMGILLDGEGYRQTTNTRDREVAQIGVLKGLGWNLLRVWTIDWWDNHNRQIDNILDQLKELKELSRQEAERRAQAENERKQEEADQQAEAERLRAELEKQTAMIEEEEQLAEQESLSTETALTDDARELTTEIGQTENDQVSIPIAEEQPRDAESAPLSSSEQGGIDPFDQGEHAPTPSTEATSIQRIFAEIIAAGGKLVDKRDNGGALWVVGGKHLSVFMKQLKAEGISFIFKAGGGKATGGKDGWWAKTDILLADITGVQIGNADGCISKPAGTEPQMDTKTIPASDEDHTKVAETHVNVPAAEPTVFSLCDPTAYVAADLVQLNWSVADFTAASNKAEVASRISQIVSVEGPILKESLFRKLFASCGVTKTSATTDAAERAAKVAKVKNSKLKGIVFCWAPDQDPKDYLGIRISTTRNADEIPPQEIKNAAVYVLRQKKALDKDELVKEVSLVFGYKRLGKNLEAAILSGVQFAKTSGAITTLPGGKYAVADD